jgi:hypothetical protein
MMHFLSGLPRSGSTVLAAILNQNPLVHVTPTSGLISIMGAVAEKWERDESIHVQGRNDDDMIRMLRGLMQAKNETITKPVIIDKNRGWPAPPIMKTMTKVLGQKPKIIATVRSVPDCIASFVRVVKPDNVQKFLAETHLIDVVKTGYVTLHAGMLEDPLSFCLIEYEDLLADPKTQLDRIHQFLELEPFTYDFERIEGSVVAEKDDEVWGIPGLHDIKPKLERQHKQTAQEVLGHRYHEFNQPRFWLGETEESRPKQPLDLQLEAGRRGDFQKAWEIAQHLERVEPENHRAAYNRGLYVLMQGKLQEGMQLLARGRIEQVFGNRKPQVPTELWQGQPHQTVLLYLEGGLGDQIHQMRFVQDITARNCQVIVACSPELVTLFATVPNVRAVAVHEAAPGVYHHAWVPGMSAPIPLGIEYKDVWGRAYIPCPQVTKDKFRIGLRWQGNPNFEHDHRKYFPPELLFNAVKGFDVEFVSLQRDEGAQHRPEWIAESKLDSWQDTQLAVAGCDLVISSCTSVAHLSAAMGIPTWVAIPILPYYLWALPGSSVPWYDAVRLFRQSKYDTWDDVFEMIRSELSDYLNGVHHGRIRSMG